MRYTLLEMVQRILESIDGDAVNSYSDTDESREVANIIKETYFYMINGGDFPANETYFNLVASGDNTKPCLMTIPSDVLEIDYIKYKRLNSSGDNNWDEVRFMDQKSFIEKVLSFSESKSNVDTMEIALDGTNFTFKYYNDRPPSFYTRVGVNQLVFNAFDSAIDSTLQSSKTLCWGKKTPSFVFNDNFIPRLDAQQFQLLLNEAKSQAYAELKQTQNPKTEQRARRAFITNQRNKRDVPAKVPEQKRVPNYGRP